MPGVFCFFGSWETDKGTGIFANRKTVYTGMDKVVRIDFFRRSGETIMAAFLIHGHCVL